MRENIPLSGAKGLLMITMPDGTSIQMRIEGGQLTIDREEDEYIVNTYGGSSHTYTSPVHYHVSVDFDVEKYLINKPST